MLKKMKSAFGGKKILLLLLLLAFILPLKTFASVSTVVVSYPGTPGPIFSQANIAPGDSFTKPVTVTNNSSTNQQFKFKATATDPIGILSDKITIQVVNTGTGLEKYNNTLAKLYADGEINLDVLAPTTPTQYNFMAKFDETAGNEYQGLSERFDLTIGFAAAPTTNPATVGGGISNPANPLLALAGFLGFTPTTVTTTTETPAVAGTENQNEVKGNEDHEKGITKTCFWWWIIALILAAVLAIYGVYLSKSKRETWFGQLWYIWPVILGIAAWIGHHFLHDSFRATWYCNWYWLVVLVELLIGYIIYRLVIREQERQV
jgi:hypothetical protein